MGAIALSEITDEQRTALRTLVQTCMKHVSFTMESCTDIREALEAYEKALHEKAGKAHE